MTQQINIPNSTDEITPEWLTMALRDGGGTVDGETAVVTITATRFGQDESFAGGTLLHLTITYNTSTQSLPPTLVAKLSPKDPAMRQQNKGINEREIRFYVELAAGQNNLPIPLVYYGAFDDETGASILLLEDLTDFRAVKYVEGCQQADAEQVVQALAQIHALWWNSPQLADLNGMEMLDDFSLRECWLHYAQKVSEILPDFILPDSFMVFGQQVVDNEITIFKQLLDTDAMTCIHRDFHVDNVLFGARATDSTVRILDWQFAGK